MNVADVLFGEPIERTLPDGWTVRIQKKTSCDKANHLWHDNAYPWCFLVYGQTVQRILNNWYRHQNTHLMVNVDVSFPCLVRKIC